MAIPNTPNEAISLSDFPEDVQLCILSFLTPSEVSTFASTSKRSLSLCRSDAKLWFALCHRRWGSKTHIHKWTRNGKRITYKQLYKTLDEYDNLIGFWRRSGNPGGGLNSLHPPPPPLVFFEWGPSFVTGSRVSPSKTPGSYRVVKSPFIWLGVMENGSPVSFVDPECRIEPYDDLDKLLENELEQLVPVNVSFMGKSHMVVEENLNFSYANSPEGMKIGGLRRVSSSGNMRGEECNGVVDEVSGSPGSLPDRVMLEIYQYFANRTSPGGERASRRQRRREKERQGRRRKWEPEHFVKIVNCSPTRLRPLQGLWKVVFLLFFVAALLITSVCNLLCNALIMWVEVPMFNRNKQLLLFLKFSRFWAVSQLLCLYSTLNR